jgi:hypothetical protein
MAAAASSFRTQQVGGHRGANLFPPRPAIDEMVFDDPPLKRLWRHPPGSLRVTGTRPCRSGRSGREPLLRLASSSSLTEEQEINSGRFVSAADVLQ